MKRLVILLILALFIAGAVLAVRWLPWWALVIGLLLLLIVGKFLLGRLLRKLFLMPFRAKGAVLRGASATVHEVSPTISSSEETTPEASHKPRTHYLLEATISPVQTDGPFGYWEPGEIRLVRPESILRPESDESDEDDACEISGLEVKEDGVWKAHEGMKFPGSQRLRMQLAVLPGIRQLKLRYYFEEFGRIELP